MFGKNIANERYLTNIAATQIGTHYGEAGPPAAWGTEQTARF